MRIQNNITAMNTHRMYTINNDNVAKSAEKLSSGYRINRAGDDAAGLAISEKMRSQIRGLNMATKNSQDAISLVQTAEGALQETHSMLQRMNELAVQAATGTNEDFDRNALAKEFEQLKREINDVAEQTNFNNMKILDGSLSYEGYVRSAATAGVNNTITSATAADSPLSTVFSKDAVQAVGNQQGIGNFTLSDKGTLKAGDMVTVQVKIGDKVYEGTSSKILTTTNVTAAGEYASGKTIKDLAGELDGLKVKIGNDEYTLAKGTSNADQMTLTGPGTATENVDWSKAEISIVRHSNNDGDDTGATFTAGSTQTNAVKAVSAAEAEKGYSFDMSKVSYGDTITLNGKTYEIAKPDAAVTDGKLANGNYAVKWNGKTNDEQDLVSNLAAAIKANPGANDANVDAPVVKGNTIYLTGAGSTLTATATAQNVADANAKVEMTFGSGNPNKGVTNTIEFDIAKMKDGDKFTISAGGKDIEVTYNEGDTRRGFMDKVAAAAQKQGIGEVKGNALIIKDEKVTNIGLESGKLPETNAIRIQVGANEHEQLSISIDSMNTKGLGLDDSTLLIAGASTTENQDAAGKAITAVKSAINKVSDQRATLGAMQNRLDHKIANLKVSSENLSAAESRIRDVDMASEMTNFTKNNILSQAATAMLAQANSLPQNVLSLLG